MSGFEDERDLAGFFQVGEAAVEAIYTDAGGIAAPVPVIESQPDAELFSGGQSFTGTSTTFLAMAGAGAGQIQTPRKGETLAVDGVTYKIQDGARRETTRAIWRIPAVPQ